MIEFRTLGTPDLRDDADGHELLSVLAQPKRVGLLAFIAVSEGGRPVSREKLLALFWPEASTSRARNALNQAVFVLRRAMGSALVTDGEGCIGADAARLTCDAWGFEERIAAGDKPEALALYDGSFLDGLYVSGAPAFERWLETTRTHYRDLALAAANELIEEAESAGKSGEALEWARRAAGLAPYDEAVHRHLLRCLLQVGNRTGTIRAYQAFAAKLERDLGFEPSTETQALFELAHQEPATVPTSVPDFPGTDHVSPTARRTGWLRTATHVGAAAALLGVGALVGRTFERSAASDLEGNLPHESLGTRALDPKRVLLARFTNLSTEPGLDPFGLAAADWITNELGRTGWVRVVPFFTVMREMPYLEPEEADPRAASLTLAERTGSGLLVTGSYVRDGNELALQAQIVDVADGELLAGIGELTGSAEAPTELLIELRDRVAGALAQVLDPRLRSLGAASLPPSIEAFRLYADGLDRYLEYSRAEGPQIERAPLLLSAAETFGRAAALDSGFTAPLVWASLAYRAALEFERADSVLSILAAREQRLAPWDRAMLEYQRAGIDGDLEAQYRAAQAIVDLAPDPEWSSKLASAAYALNRPRESARILLGMDPERGWLQGERSYWMALTIALHGSGDHQAELRAAERYRVAFPDDKRGTNAFERRALVGLGRTAEAVQLAVDAGDVYSLWEVALDLRAHGHEAAARRVVDGPFAPWVAGADTAAPSRALVWALEQAQRWDDAARIIERGIARWAGSEESTEPLNRLQLNSLINWHGEAGVLAAIKGELETAQLQVRWLDGLELRQPNGHAQLWQARIAAQLERLTEAVEALRRACAEGYSNHFWIHMDPRLDPLRGYPPFEEFVRPKG